jgi:hypothetical protein
MTKWMRRSMFSIGSLVAIALALSAIALLMFRATPAWYGPATITAAEREALARAAENKLIEAQNWAAQLRADEVRLARATERGTSRPATRAADAITIALDQREIAALFDKWSVLYGWRTKYQQFFEDPQLLLRDGLIVVAGKVKELGSVVSLQFQPRVDAHGKLHMELRSVTGGKLPLPELLWYAWRDKMMTSINQKMPSWRRQASISPTGAANTSAMAATMGQFLLHVAHRQAAEPILFLPLADRGESVPVKVQDVKVGDGELILMVTPLTPAQRATLLARIRP